MVREFGDYLPDGLKPKKSLSKNRNASPPAHQTPIF